MACIKLLDVPPIPLPGLTIPIPSTPPIDISIDYCCRLQLLSVPPFTPPPPEVILALIGVDVTALEVAATVLAINTAIDKINAYKNSLPLSCPFD